MIDFYFEEWQKAKKEGNYAYAETCKEQYFLLTKASLKRPYRQYIYVLNAWLPIYLN